MSLHFHPLRVADIVKETEDCVSIAFEIPQELKKYFQYKSGQYVTLRFNLNGEDIRRSYSISSSPLAENEFCIAIKKVRLGKVSTFLNENVRAGDTIDVFPPEGNFTTPLNALHQKNYVMFAGGSGITPIISLIKSILHAEPKGKTILFYGNQNGGAIIFRKQLEELAQKNSDRFQLFNILEKRNAEENLPAGEAGFPDKDLFTGVLSPNKNKLLLEKFVDLKKENEYFICGPTGMMNSVSETLKSIGVADKNIHLEYFSAPQINTQKKFVSHFNGVSRVVVILDGDEIELELRGKDKILDCALEAGLDVPFACKGGNCSTCAAKLMKGKVEMEKNFALTEERVKKGFILTCQSHPLTEKIVVDYDAAR